MTPAQVVNYLTNMLDVTQDQRVAVMLVMIMLVIAYTIILSSGDSP